VERALDLHADELSAFPNVVGLGTGLTGSDDRPESEREHALAVYVTEKKPQSELEPDAVLPFYVEIPGRGTTLKVAIQVVEIGELTTESSENQGDEELGGSTFGPE
jgi:hypothetical protein